MFKLICLVVILTVVINMNSVDGFHRRRNEQNSKSNNVNYIVIKKSSGCKSGNCHSGSDDKEWSHGSSGSDHGSSGSDHGSSGSDHYSSGSGHHSSHRKGSCSGGKCYPYVPNPGYPVNNPTNMPDNGAGTVSPGDVYPTEKTPIPMPMPTTTTTTNNTGGDNGGNVDTTTTTPSIPTTTTMSPDIVDLVRNLVNQIINLLERILGPALAGILRQLINRLLNGLLGGNGSEPLNITGILGALRNLTGLNLTDLNLPDLNLSDLNLGNILS